MSKRGSGEREEYWRGVVERQRRSGQTVLGFCRENGVAQASFYHWRARLSALDQRQLDARERHRRRGSHVAVGERRRPRAASSAAVGLKAAASAAVDSRLPLAEATPFIPLKLPAVLGLGNVIEVLLPRGHLVRVPAGFDSEALRRILELLDAGDA